MKYEIRVEELLSRVVEVEADNDEEAEKKLKRCIKNKKLF